MSIQTKYGSANLTGDGYYMITSVKEGNFKNKEMLEMMADDINTY